MFKLFSIFQSFQNLQVFRPEIINLCGPFLSEEEALKYPEIYQDILEKTWLQSNTFISRDFLITSDDSTFLTRDDIRLQCGITHHQHLLELCVEGNALFQPVAIDHIILLNEEDRFKIKYFLNTVCPLKLQECQRKENLH